MRDDGRAAGRALVQTVVGTVRRIDRVGGDERVGVGRGVGVGGAGLTHRHLLLGPERGARPAPFAVVVPQIVRLQRFAE